MKLIIIRMSLELLLVLANIDTPVEPEFFFSTVQSIFMEQSQ